jgi:endonuclease G
VLDEKPENYATIGTNKVSVPKYYYKVILAPLYCDKNDRATKDDAEKVTAVGFIFPNTKCDGSFYDYACSVDEVEKRTGINFFEGLEDTAEDEAEKTFDVSVWK